MSSEQPKLTIREVAEAAGVSRMTVTRVMRQDPLVTPKTREAVEAVIKRLGYQPSQAARNLGSSRPRVIGVISQRSAETEALGQGMEYLNTLHLGALQVCNEAQYGLIFFPEREVESVETFVRRVKTKQVSGYVIAAPTTESPGLMETLRANDIPFSAINPANTEHSPLSVVSNDRLATRQLVEEMIRQGHRRIAFAGAGGHARACRERLAGYRDALAKSGVKGLKPIIYESPSITFTDGLELGRRLFDEPNPPTAIQCITDDMAAGLIAAAHGRRLLMPEVLSIGGFDNFGLATRLYPALSTAALPLMAMAVAAAEQVLQTLEGKPVQAQRSFDCKVVMRDSIGPVHEAG